MIGRVYLICIIRTQRKAARTRFHQAELSSKEWLLQYNLSSICFFPLLFSLNFPWTSFQVEDEWMDELIACGVTLFKSMMIPSVNLRDAILYSVEAFISWWMVCTSNENTTSSGSMFWTMIAWLNAVFHDRKTTNYPHSSSYTVKVVDVIMFEIFVNKCD